MKPMALYGFSVLTFQTLEINTFSPLCFHSLAIRKPGLGIRFKNVLKRGQVPFFFYYP